MVSTMTVTSLASVFYWWSSGPTSTVPLDDGSRPNHARLKKVWQLSWSKEDGASTVLPHDAGIHRVGNLGIKMAISVEWDSAVRC
jgi:hypothetical protein